MSYISKLYRKIGWRTSFFQQSEESDVWKISSLPYKNDSVSPLSTKKMILFFFYQKETTDCDKAITESAFDEPNSSNQRT